MLHPRDRPADYSANNYYKNTTKQYFKESFNYEKNEDY